MRYFWFLIFLIFINLFFVKICKSELFWERINVPTNDSIFTFATANNGYLYIGTQREGIYRSTDNGSSWLQINEGLIKLKITTILSSKQGKLFAIGINDGVYKSLYHGMYWEKISDTIDSLRVPYTIIANNLNELYLATDSGIYKSTNDGINWENITSNTVIHNNSCNRIISNKVNTLFAQVWGGRLGFYRKKSADSDWEKLNLSDNDVATIKSIVINSLDEMFIGTSDYGIFKTIDEGEKIDKIKDTTLTKNVYTLNINKNDHLYGIFGGQGLLRSIDKGDSWSSIDTSLLSKIMKDLWTDNNNYLIGITYDFKLYRSSQPMEIFNITTKFFIDTIPILDYLDTLSIGIEVSDRKSDELLKNVDIKVFNSITNDTTMFRSDSLGNAVYQVIVPENIDTSLYTIKFISSKFAYINDTTTFQVNVKHDEVSVEANEYVSDLRINPNPNTGVFYFQFNITKSNNLFYTINDCKGREIYKSKIQYYDKGDYKIKLDILNNQPSGYYYLKFNVGDLISTIPIIILK